MGWKLIKSKSYWGKIWLFLLNYWKFKEPFLITAELIASLLLFNIGLTFVVSLKKTHAAPPGEKLQQYNTNPKVTHD